MSSPVGVGGQQFGKFTVYVSVSGGRDYACVDVCVRVCVDCLHVYPDQLVRAQPPKIHVSTPFCGEAGLHPSTSHSGEFSFFFFQDHR